MTDPKDTPQPAPQEVEGEELDQVVGGGINDSGIKDLATIQAEQAEKAGTRRR